METRRIIAFSTGCSTKQCSISPTTSSCLRLFTVIAFRIQALRNRLSLNPALNEKSHGEHKHLLELVTRGDNEKVLELLAWHIEWTRSSYIELLETPAADNRPTRNNERRLKAGKR